MLQRQWWCWYLRQLQPAADIGACTKPGEKHGSEVHVQVSGDVRDSGDPVPGCSRLRSARGIWAVRRVQLEPDGGGWRGPTALDSPYRKQKSAAMWDLR
jgi:hypothetical protein